MVFSLSNTDFFGPSENLFITLQNLNSVYLKPIHMSTSKNYPVMRKCSLSLFLFILEQVPVLPRIAGFTGYLLSPLVPKRNIQPRCDGPSEKGKTKR